MRQVMHSGIWKTTDNCIYDLSVVAAQSQNAMIKTSPDVYYSSYSVDGTVGSVNETRVPIPTVNELVKDDCLRIGLNKKDLPYGYIAWRPNDGLVSVPSAQHPVGHKFEMVDPSNQVANLSKGVWYVNPTTEGKDHLSIVIPDKNDTIEYLYQYYETIARYMYALPK
jgi:triacylglycerol lipase